jgi:hypothetical protein
MQETYGVGCGIGSVPGKKAISVRRKPGGKIVHGAQTFWIAIDTDSV